MYKKGRFQSLIEGIDQYAKPIQLSFQQRKEFPTVCGGTLTIMHCCLMTAFLSIAILEMVEV